MKQHITEKQWLEIKPKEQRLLIVAVNNTNQLLTIGQMIEFLGIDFEHNMTEMLGNNVEKMCDALWEAVKYKLNNK